MDRTLKVYAKTGHLFAQVVFYYDQPHQVTAHYTLYQALDQGDGEDESKSVYPVSDRDLYVPFRQFASVKEIKAHDVEFVKKAAYGDMADPRDYSFTYDSTPILLRYVIEGHPVYKGLVNVLYSFEDNTKEVRYLSASNPRFDHELSTNSLETNIACIARIPIYYNGELFPINHNDLTRLEPWY
ncbi:hypothetical protein LJY25_07130 [Hymenobacter sp. BT175]|uniref:hypothetical protein n=1 Tax=Hymenobacter translucens TaxID=2886507 RepID=UPI001D0E4A20|nr:hypothetical protein [Hymenobacter translucens]MCC2546212.1 hypothetical protein [Hymenobacter translucens]